MAGIIAHKAIDHQLQTGGTGAGYARTPLIDPGSWQAEMRTVAIHRLAVIHAIRLAVRMVHVHHHWMLEL